MDYYLIAYVIIEVNTYNSWSFLVVAFRVYFDSTMYINLIMAIKYYFYESLSSIAYVHIK